MAAEALCAVCLNDVCAAERASLLECLHAFCRSCITAWARRGGRACPLCRAEFTGWRYGGGDSVFLLPTAADADALRQAAEADAREFARQPALREAARPRAAQPTPYFQRLRRSLLSSSTSAAWGAPAAPQGDGAASLARRAALYAAHARAVPPPRRRGAPARQRSRAELRAWLERDLRALLHTDDVALLCHFALALFLHAQAATPPGSGDAAATAQLAPYVGEAAAQLLLHELRSFGDSHLNMAAYDAAVRYDDLDRAAVQQQPQVQHVRRERSPSAPQQTPQHRSEPAPLARESRSPRRDRDRNRRRRRSPSPAAADNDDGGRWPMVGAEHAAAPPRVARTRR